MMAARRPQLRHAMPRPRRPLARRLAGSMAVLAVAALALASTAQAAEPPSTVVLDWNATAVDAVRAARIVEPAGTAPRLLYQTDGLLYTSYARRRCTTR
jgi:hypothetical protein